MYRAKATAIYSYKSEADDELTFDRGATINIKSTKGGEWWYGEYKGASGCVPKKYLQLCVIGQCVAIKGYIPAERKDRMRIRANDEIDILIKETDEWFGRNGIAEGWFPPTHVKEIDMNQDGAKSTNTIGREFDAITSNASVLDDLRKGRTRKQSSSKSKNHRFTGIESLDNSHLINGSSHSEDDEPSQAELAQILNRKSMPAPSTRRISIKKQQSEDVKPSMHLQQSKKLSPSLEPMNSPDDGNTSKMPSWLRELKEKKRLLKEKEDAASGNPGKADIKHELEKMASETPQAKSASRAGGDIKGEPKKIKLETIKGKASNGTATEIKRETEQAKLETVKPKTSNGTKVDMKRETEETTLETLRPKTSNGSTTDIKHKPEQAAVESPNTNAHVIDTLGLDIKKSKDDLTAKPTDNFVESLINVTDKHNNLAKSNSVTMRNSTAPLNGSCDDILKYHDANTKTENVPEFRAAATSRAFKQRPSSYAVDAPPLNFADSSLSQSNDSVNVSTYSLTAEASEDLIKRVEYLEKIVAILMDQNSDIKKQFDEMKRRGRF